MINSYSDLFDGRPQSTADFIERGRPRWVLVNNHNVAIHHINQQLIASIVLDRSKIEITLYYRQPSARSVSSGVFIQVVPM